MKGRFILRILAYLMRPKGRNAASSQAGIESKKWRARSTPLHKKKRKKEKKTKKRKKEMESQEHCTPSHFCFSLLLPCKLTFLFQQAQDGIHLPLLSLKLEFEENAD